MTYRQALELKAQVRKGEHGSLVVFADRFKKTETNDQDVKKEIPFMKGYTVFNVDQIEGLPGGCNRNPQTLAEKFLLIENAEKSINATGATFRHGGDKAYYSSSPDVIQLPCPQGFQRCRELRRHQCA